MMRARFEEPDVQYPYEGVLRFDRVAPDGEILHPYAARKDGEHWSVRFYLPFRQLFSAMPEHEFIALPIGGRRRAGARGQSVHAVTSPRSECLQRHLCSVTLQPTIAHDQIVSA